MFQNECEKFTFWIPQLSVYWAVSKGLVILDFGSIFIIAEHCRLFIKMLLKSIFMYDGQKAKSMLLKPLFHNRCIT